LIRAALRHLAALHRSQLFPHFLASADPLFTLRIQRLLQRITVSAALSFWVALEIVTARYKLTV
jgi:hypothetical protein